MKYEMKITPENGYLHIQVTGEASYTDTLEFWQKVAKACEEHQCYKILGEQNLTKTLTTSEAIDYPKLYKKAGMNESHLVAWVDHNPRTKETTTFIHDILANRFIGKGKVFYNTEDAKRWLLRETSK